MITILAKVERDGEFVGITKMMIDDSEWLQCNKKEYIKESSKMLAQIIMERCFDFLQEKAEDKEGGL